MKVRSIWDDAGELHHCIKFASCLIKIGFKSTTHMLTGKGPILGPIKIKFRMFDKYLVKDTMIVLAQFVSD